MNSISKPDLPEINIYHDQRDVIVEELSFVGGQASAFSIRCPDKETSSEDCAALIPYDENAGVLVVADGLGGLPAGDQASRMAVDRLVDSLANAARTGVQLRTAILNGFEEANQEVLDLSQGSGTTLAVVEIQDHWVRPYHVGDSVIMVVGQRGKRKLQTVSHSPIGYAVEAGFLDDAEAMHHEERHLISNMIGSPDMHITIGSAIELAVHDTVLVASDGLLDNLHSEEIVERIRKGSLATVSRTLAQDSLDRMASELEGNPSKPDDLTAIIYRGRPLATEEKH